MSNRDLMQDFFPRPSSSLGGPEPGGRLPKAAATTNQGMAGQNGSLGLLGSEQRRIVAKYTHERRQAGGRGRCSVMGEFNPNQVFAPC